MIGYTCPTCGRTIQVKRREEAPCRPFCGERCQMIDLGKWLNGEYVISEPGDADSTGLPERDSRNSQAQGP